MNARTFCLTLWLFTPWLFAPAQAQSGLPPVGAYREAGILYLSLADLASALGYVPSASEASFVLRTPQGILSVFADSTDLLWRVGSSEEERSLEAPVRRREGVWYGPAGVLEPLGVQLEGETLRSADGRTLRLALERPAQDALGATRIELGGAAGFAFYAPGPAGSDTLSLLVLDAGLLGLALPTERARLDAQMGRFGDVKPLYFILSALAETSWRPEFVLEQGETRLELRYPYTVGLLAGDPSRVGPDAPAVGLILAPPQINLRAPLRFTWNGQSAELQFRR